MISDRQKWCGCQKRKETEVAHPKKGKVQQSGTWAGALESTAKHGFMLEKLKRPIIVRNMDGTNNSGGAITHQVEANVYYKGHIERMRMDICDLGKTEVILGML